MMRLACLSLSLLSLFACSTTPPPSMPQQTIVSSFGIKEQIPLQQQTTLTAERAVTFAIQYSPKIQQILAEFELASLNNQQQANWPELQLSLAKLIYGDASQVTSHLELAIGKLLWQKSYQQRANNRQQQATNVAYQQLLAFTQDIRSTFYQYQMSQAQAVSLNDINEAAAALVVLAKRQYQAGNINIREQNKAILAKANSQMAIEENLRQQQTLRAELNLLLGLSGDNAKNWQVSTDLPLLPTKLPELGDVESFAISHHPSMILAEKTLIGQQIHAKINQHERWLPDANIGIEREKSSNEPTKTGGTFSFKLPFFAAKQQQIAQTETRISQVWRDNERLNLQLKSRLAVQQWQSYWQEARFWQDKLLPLHAEIRQETALHYNGMLEGIESLIESRQNELEAQHRYLQALTQFALAQAELEQWLTMPITQAITTLDVKP